MLPPNTALFIKLFKLISSCKQRFLRGALPHAEMFQYGRLATGAVGYERGGDGGVDEGGGPSFGGGE